MSSIPLSLQRLSRKVDEAFREGAKEAVEQHFKDTVAKGTDPYGEPWPPSSDGGTALRGAYEALEITADGDAIVVSLPFPYGFHHHGAGGTSDSKDAARSMKYRARKRKEAGSTNKFHAPRRRVLPDEGMPPKLEKTIAKLVARKVSRAAK